MTTLINIDLLVDRIRCFSDLDELVKSRISDGFVKSPRSRLANPEEGGVLSAYAAVTKDEA